MVLLFVLLVLVATVLVAMGRMNTDVTGAKTTFLLSVILLLVGLPLLGLSAQWAALRLARVTVNTVTVFCGSPVTSFPLLGATVVIGYIPTGESVDFDISMFRSKPLPVRLAVILSGPAALLIVAIAFLGFTPALHHFGSGFFQLPLRSRTDMAIEHVYEVRPRRDHRGVDLISEALPFGRLPTDFQRITPLRIALKSPMMRPRPAPHLHLGKSEIFDQAAKFRKSSVWFPAHHSGKTGHHTLQPLAWLE
jgi:hypothetical protein